MKRVQDCLEGILTELELTLGRVEERETDGLIWEIMGADRVFVAGAGRSALMIRAFAMRLMHLGLRVYVAGEIVTPAIGCRDLLIVASSSGETETLCVIARKAKAVGAKLALITAHPDSSVGSLADVCIQINTEGLQEKIQSTGSTFEQALLLLGDALMMKLSDSGRFGAGDVDIDQFIRIRHANLE